MRFKFSSLLLLLPLLLCTPIINAKTAPNELAKQAASADASKAAKAIAELRALGPTGLKVLFTEYANLINSQVANPLQAETAEWRRVSKALDEVSQQKNNYLSGLYWYTDMGQAKSAARAAGKPIISLRLLGNLNEEFSCANSRFFRTVLYSNEEVSRMLRNRFILHWQSVRPAPRVTIDFGDGRKLERTLTGNSIHYILDANGRPLDALPGLYGPKAFMRALTLVDALSKQLATKADVQGRFAVPRFHRDRLNNINVAWAVDTQTIGGKLPKGFVLVTNEKGTPAALEIASLAITKMVTEATILRSMTAGSRELERITDEDAWRKLAFLHLADAQLDARSMGLIQRQAQKVFEKDKQINPETALAKMIEKLEMNIALDTVRNEYLLHTKLYAWLLSAPGNDVEELNRKVYAELFLTPASDPWLGLFSADTYVALQNGGLEE
ncbi:MAG TPA: hypothetical protein VGW36_07775 [Pyrinomonadaceae bacterium]|nr:hypothetical protein [Pyrinomonadaceae bacterium]